MVGLAPGLVAAALFLSVDDSSESAVGPEVILAAGDIADCKSQGDEQTSALLDARAGTILTLGDNAYDSGTAQEFADCYGPSWGKHKLRTRPAPGNHDYNTPGASGYFDYFGENAGPRGPGYYSFDLGGWHLISLNSESDTGAGGAQAHWLRNDLAATNADCVLAYWHRPRWTSGAYTDLPDTAAFWDILYDAGADVVLAGHDHSYQRYPKLGKTGALDPNGIRSFVVGTGGRSRYPLAPDPRREAATDGAWGVLQLTLRESSFDWQFVTVDGTSADSGTAGCSPAAKPPPVTPPPPPPVTPPPPPPVTPPPPPPVTPPSPGPVTPPAAPPPAVTPRPPAIPPPASPATPPPAPSPPPPPANVSPAPTPPSPSAALRRALTILSVRVHVSAVGKAPLRLTCRDARACAGWLHLHRGRLQLGRASFAFGRAASGLVTVPLKPTALRLLAARGSLRVRAVATSAGRVLTSRVVQLRSRRRA